MCVAPVRITILRGGMYKKSLPFLLLVLEVYMQKYKIALTGAGGVGKGTLVEAFRKLHPEFVSISSPMHPIASIISPQAKNYEDYDIDAKNILQYSCLCAEMNAERVALENGFSFIAERSVIDFLAYYRQIFRKKRVKEYRANIYRFLESSPYNLLAYVPITFSPTSEDLKENAWKERDADSRLKTDACIREELLSMQSRFPSVRVVTVIGGTPEARAANLADMLGRF